MKLDILSRLPSLQDLASAAQLFQYNKPSVIYPQSGGETILTPIQGKTPKIDPKKYQELVQSAVDNGDISIVVNGLKDMGISMSGKADGKLVGSPDMKLKAEVEKFGATIPRSGSNEIGGTSGLSKGGMGATKRHVTGTPDHVEVPVEISPEDALKGTDKSQTPKSPDFMFHTHLTNNNYPK